MKLPKTFLAINLSDAFSFEDEKAADGELADAADGEVLEMKALSHADDATPMALETDTTAIIDDQPAQQ